MSLFSKLFRKAPPPAPLQPPAAEPIAEQAIATVVPAAPMVDMNAQEEEALQAAITGQDYAAIAHLAIDGSSTRIRQLAADAVHDPAQIKKLIREGRGKDKNVYKILKQKNDALLAEERKAAQIQADLESICAALEKHTHRVYDALFAPTLDHLDEQWHALAMHAPPELAQRAEKAIDRCREMISEYVQNLARQDALRAAMAKEAADAEQQRQLKAEADAAAAAQAAEARAAEEKERSEKAEVEALALRQLTSLLRKAGGALSDGNTRRAAGLRRAIEEKLPAMPMAVPPHLTRQLQQIDEKLGMLRDWKNYVAAPKRIQLIEDMESLAGSTEDPAELAEHIHDLQEEWKTLTKGVNSDHEAEWQRFHQAAQAAYQPCKEHFEAQAAIRRENLEKRQALADRLAAFEANHDWANADWTLVMTALREAKQQWYSHTPVDRSPGRVLQERFDTLIGGLQARLDAEFAKNIEERKSLIEKTQRLLESPDTAKAIEEVKRLQLMWRALGPAPHREDKPLWEQFRQQCDAVFQKRQQEYAAQASELDANKAKAVAMCEEVEQIAALSGQELLDGAKKLPQMREAFDGIGELPKAKERDLFRRFERALEKCDSAVTRQRVQDKEQSWKYLFEAADKVRAYRLAATENADTAQRDALRQAAEDYIAGVRHWPKGGQQAVKAELAKEGATDIAANESALRLLCIRAEILTDSATPDEDMPLRRDYQVKRLMQSMGQGSGSGSLRDQLDALAFEWIAVGPAEAGVYSQLQQRFMRCRERSPG